MGMNFFNKYGIGLMLWWLALVNFPGNGWTEESKPSAPFGFKEMEIYRASRSANSLRAVDLNGDGRIDLVYANNDDTSICLLIQKAGAEAPVGPAIDAAVRPAEKVNEIQFDQRF